MAADNLFIVQLRKCISNNEKYYLLNKEKAKESDFGKAEYVEIPGSKNPFKMVGNGDLRGFIF